MPITSPCPNCGKPAAAKFQEQIVPREQWWVCTCVVGPCWHEWAGWGERDEDWIIVGNERAPHNCNAEEDK